MSTPLPHGVCGLRETSYKSIARRAGAADGHVTLGDHGDEHGGQGEAEGAAGDDEGNERVGGFHLPRPADQDVRDRVEDGHGTYPGRQGEGGRWLVAGKDPPETADAGEDERGEAEPLILEAAVD